MAFAPAIEVWISPSLKLFPFLAFVIVFYRKINNTLPLPFINLHLRMINYSEFVVIFILLITILEPATCMACY